MASILPAFRLKRSNTREQLRSWVREQFMRPERLDTFIEEARPILKDAGIPSKVLRREWVLGARSELLPRLRDRLLDQIEDATQAQIDTYAQRRGPT